MKDNELRSFLERIAHAVECIADSLRPKEAEERDEGIRLELVAEEEKKEPEIIPEEKAREIAEVTAEDVEEAEIAFNEFIDKHKEELHSVVVLPHEEEKPVEEVKVEEKPIVKKSPSKPRKEVKRINPYRKPEDGPRKPVSGFRIKED